jgi:bifunctional non-homologous end joining protein LigD
LVKNEVPPPPVAEAIEVQLATLVDTAPGSDQWLHEIKLDGYRIAARIDRGSVQLLTRRQNDWTERAPKVVEALGSLPVTNAVLDGEIVSLQPDGRSDFQSLQNALSEARSGSLVYYVFDLLFLDGRDLTSQPLLARKAELATLLGTAKLKQIRLSDHVVGGGPQFFQQACKLKLEGIIAKRADAPYRPGRSKDWLKIKCIARQEFVIGGYTLPEGSRTHLGALLVGVREGERLRYAGKVGTGFTQRSLRELHAQLTPLARTNAPFDQPLKGAAFRGARWVEPKLVAEVSFSEFTQDGRLRHPSFQGLREDKPASAVARETPVAVSERGSTRTQQSQTSTPKTAAEKTAAKKTAAKQTPARKTASKKVADRQTVSKKKVSRKAGGARKSAR